MCFCMLASASTGLHLLLHASTCFCRLTSAYAGLHMIVQACICFRRHTSASAGFYRRTSASACLHLLLSACIYRCVFSTLGQSIWRTAEQSFICSLSKKLKCRRTNDNGMAHGFVSNKRSVLAISIQVAATTGWSQLVFIIVYSLLPSEVCE